MGSTTEERTQHYAVNEAAGEVGEMLLSTVKGRTNEVTGW